MAGALEKPVQSVSLGGERKISGQLSNQRPGGQLGPGGFTVTVKDAFASYDML